MKGLKKLTQWKMLKLQRSQKNNVGKPPMAAVDTLRTRLRTFTSRAVS